MPEFPLTNAYWPAQTSTPLGETTIGSILRDAAARAPDKIALIDGDPAGGQRRRWTYRALLADAERAARALLRRFSPDERIAVWSGNSPEWLILEFAAALAGLTLVTVNPAYRGDELAHVLGHSEADGLFLADTYQGADLHAILAEIRGRLPRLREVISLGDRDGVAVRMAGTAPLPSVAPSDVAQLMYTSGTTGRPKGALLTHRGLTNNARLAFDGGRHRPRRRTGQPDAAVPRRRRPVHPRRRVGHRHPGADAPVLPRPAARADRDAPGHGAAGRADDDARACSATPTCPRGTSRRCAGRCPAAPCRRPPWSARRRRRSASPTRSRSRRPSRAARSPCPGRPTRPTTGPRRSAGRCPTPRCASPTWAPARPPPAAPSARSAPGATW